ncbi:hypothetical protein G3260_004282 [Streptomyces albus]|uniref:hypothetical protein n=1 Tax=Streptomyces TaxID=1883 RepID=UPI00034E9163|nr:MULTISPECIES: hypothetical protein [Streptomyces]EPD89246.1 hypothetical protein HMPREF1486_06566 [Streptomyces sp. HPH0547]QID37775.1 hypothetical protein G3260_004282 [Streptomyces albus]
MPTESTATLTLMWEAKAAPGQGSALLDWARAQELSPAPFRREHFTAPGERVLVITWWEGGGDDHNAAVPELPPPPSELIARPVHRWRFTRV